MALKSIVSKVAHKGPFTLNVDFAVVWDIPLHFHRDGNSIAENAAVASLNDHLYYSVIQPPQLK